MTKRKTNEDFVADVFELVGDEYTFLETYQLSRLPLEVRHNLCGHVYKVKPNNFLNGKRCPRCASSFKSTQTFRMEVESISDGNLEVTGEYIHCTHPVMIKCKLHEREFERLPSDVLRGRKVCPDCNAEYLSKSQRKESKVFEEELLNRHNGTLICTGDYINTHTKVKFKCLSCNTSFKAEPNSVLRISGCPSCSESKGEKLIREYLVRNGITFIPQKGFPDCKHVRTLPFDFYLPEYETLIEYHGKQHYEPIEFFGGDDTFEKQVYRDHVKKGYAKKNNLHLVVIPYTIQQGGIEVILDEYFRFGKPTSILE